MPEQLISTPWVGDIRPAPGFSEVAGAEPNLLNTLVIYLKLSTYHVQHWLTSSVLPVIHPPVCFLSSESEEKESRFSSLPSSLLLFLADFVSLAIDFPKWIHTAKKSKPSENSNDETPH